MSRASRLLDLLELLRKRRVPVPGLDLAQELGISIRTLYRDIATLQAQGADIQGEPGLGYVLRPGFTLPPLMFSIDELEALILGSSWVARLTDDARLSSAAGNAMSKITAVLPSDLRDTIDATALVVPARKPPPAQIDPGILRDAIRKEHTLRIGYRDEAGGVTQRTVWPFIIGFFEQHRVVGAWCELRQDFRHFRLDRMATAEATGSRAPRRRHALLKEWRAMMRIPPATAGN